MSNVRLGAVLSLFAGLATIGCGNDDLLTQNTNESNDPRCIGLPSSARVWFTDGDETVALDCGPAGGNLVARYQREAEFACEDGTARATAEVRRGLLLELVGQCCEESSTHFENGTCISSTRTCELADAWPDEASGSQTWSDGAWSPCEFLSCPPDTHLEQMLCVSDERRCILLTGEGSEFWNGEAWGPCVANSCPVSFHLEAGACISNVQPCPIANGIGEQRWNGTSYDRCRAIDCDVGFQLLNDVCAVEFTEREQLIWDTYTFYFGRVPTDVGLSFWVSEPEPDDDRLVANILSGASLDDREYVIQNRRVEARDHYLSTNQGPTAWLLVEPEPLVTSKHRLYFGREVQPGELQFWVAQWEGDDVATEATIILSAEGSDRDYLLSSAANAARNFLTIHSIAIPTWLE